MNRKTTLYGLTALVGLTILTVAWNAQATSKMQRENPQNLGISIQSPRKAQFQIYDSSSGGRILWSESGIVSFDAKGLCTVSLGSVVAIPDSVLERSGRWLGISLDGEKELFSRIAIANAPFAHLVPASRPSGRTSLLAHFAVITDSSGAIQRVRDPGGNSTGSSLGLVESSGATSQTTQSASGSATGPVLSYPSLTPQQGMVTSAPVNSNSIVPIPEYSSSGYLPQTSMEALVQMVQAYQKRCAELQARVTELEVAAALKSAKKR